MQVCIGCGVFVWGSKGDGASIKCGKCQQVGETLGQPATKDDESLAETRCSLCGMYLDDEVIEIQVGTIPNSHSVRT